MHWIMIEIVHLYRFVHTASAKVDLFQKCLVGAFEANDAEFARHITTLGTESVAEIVNIRMGYRMGERNLEPTGEWESYGAVPWQ
jgi:hypothetical protein